jgi:GNAT superfamily N-acetyltransferase
VSDAYEVLRYRPEHRAQLIELQKELWSSDAERNAAYFEWKYERNPYLAEILIYVATIGGQVVGMRGFFGGRWEAGQPREELAAYCADDLVIAPAHRNRGLFTRIMRAAFADLALEHEGYAFTLSGSPTTVLSSLTTGWKSIGTMCPVEVASQRRSAAERLLGALGRRRFLWRLRAIANKALERPPRGFVRLDANANGSTREAGAIRLERAPRPAAMASLVDRLGHDGRIRHVRDTRYFAWRFQNPLHEYRFLYAGDAPLDGYLVLRRYLSDKADPTRVHVSDWEAADGPTRRALLDAAIRWGEFPRLGAWTATLPPESCRVLSEAGFVETDAEQPVLSAPSILVRPIRPIDGEWAVAGKPLLDLSSWDLRMLYSMHG